MKLFYDMSDEYADYLHDESRTVGSAESISFPTSIAQIQEILAYCNSHEIAVTVQGGRTGLAAGAVPNGGHIINLTRMNHCTSMRQAKSVRTAQMSINTTTTQSAAAVTDGRNAEPSCTITDDTSWFLVVEPGAVLSQVRKDLEDKNIQTAAWTQDAKDAWSSYVASGEDWFFPTDPTETSATFGGMAACNASGARSYYYHAMRPHVSALDVVLADGDLLHLPRGRFLARDYTLELITESGRTIQVPVPRYTMPHTKNASGYYSCENVDAVDLFIGSDATLGVIASIEVELMRTPALTYGVSCFFDNEHDAVQFTQNARKTLACARALEYFDADALDILRTQKRSNTAFAQLPSIPDDASSCIYCELVCDDEAHAQDTLDILAQLLDACSSNAQRTWVARTDIDRESLRFFRHAVPESVNMLIDERRRQDPTITKLGSDMSVPDEHLEDVIALYRTTLAEEGLQTAAWGHIGNNHLHVNILPHNADEYARGKALFARWAHEVVGMGGAVSAEHGVGKLKRDFLLEMYRTEGISQMAQTKAALDPHGILARGNLFDFDVFLGVARGGAA